MGTVAGSRRGWYTVQESNTFTVSASIPERAIPAIRPTNQEITMSEQPGETYVIGTDADGPTERYVPEPLPFVPLGDRVYVELVEQKDETDSGILLATEKKKRPQTGVVIALGNQAADFFQDLGVDVTPGTILRLNRNEITGEEIDEQGERNVHVARAASIRGVYAS